MVTEKPKTNILITGASSGIGAALAAEYAEMGNHLVLTGRNPKRLTAISAACRGKGAKAAEHIIDVTDTSAMNALFQTDGPFDLVFANAGIAGPEGGGFAENTRLIFSVNIDGVANTLIPAIESMKENGGGQIGIVSSIAGFRGLPSAPAYAASKAAVKSWGEGLRGRYAADGIRVSVICPGFVESAITASNDFRMPLLMDAPRAARIIRRGMERNKGLIAFPLPMLFGAWLMTVLPNRFVDWATRRLPRKE